MKRILCAFAALLLSASALADGGLLFDVGSKASKIKDGLNSAGIVSLQHGAMLPYWEGVQTTFWEIGEDYTVEIGGDALTWIAKPLNVRYITYDKKLFAITFDTDADSAAADWEAVKEALSAEYGEPEETPWVRENTVTVNGKKKKMTLYPHQYKWAVDEKTGIKVTVTMDKNGKVQKVGLSVSIQRRDMDETIRAADESR